MYYQYHNVEPCEMQDWTTREVQIVNSESNYKRHIWKLYSNRLQKFDTRIMQERQRPTPWVCIPLTLPRRSSHSTLVKCGFS